MQKIIVFQGVFFCMQWQEVFLVTLRTDAGARNKNEYERDVRTLYLRHFLFRGIISMDLCRRVFPLSDHSICRKCKYQCVPTMWFPSILFIFDVLERTAPDPSPEDRRSRWDGS